MSSARRLAATAVAMAAVIGAASAVAAVSAPPASAETGVSVTDVCPRPRSGESTRVNLLILLDTSGSLKTNDPANLRSAGTKDALQVVESLSSRFADADVGIEIAVDTFDQRYFRKQGWIPADGVYQRLGEAIEAIATDDGRYTDYVEALTGAWSRFAAHSDDCNLLIWFTDGEHDTASGAEGEERELSQLCSSPAMRSLREQVWVGAVQLNTADAAGSRLRYLYGEDAAGGALPCVNAVRGRIYDDFDPSSLQTVLSELISTTIGQTDESDEPGTPSPRRPAPEDFVPCTGGDGSRESPCVVAFDLAPSVESFRAFVDLTLIERGIENPDSVLVAVRSPDGSNSPSIGGDGDIRPGEQVGRYLRVDPFAFYARSNYRSDLQIVGHQVAERRVSADQWQWQWDGRWELLFFGDSPEAQSDARRVAAEVRFVTTDAPTVEPFRLDPDDALSGFVKNYPHAGQGSAGPRLDVGVESARGEPVYPTRPLVNEAPLEVSAPPDRKFEVPSFLDALVLWDAKSGGGDDASLREAVEESGGLSATARMEQEFLYGDEPVRWERRIGEYALSAVEVQRLLDKLAGRDRVRDITALLEADAVWLPSGIELGTPLVAGDKVSIPVAVSPGALAGLLTLDETSVTVLDAVSAPPDAADPPADARRPAALRIGADPWRCEVPGVPGPDGDRFTCPVPLPLRVEVGRETELAARLEVAVAEQPDAVGALLEGVWFPPGSSEGGRLSELVSEAAQQERLVQRLESARFTVEGPPPPPPPPPPVDDRLRAFWPMLGVLIGLAAAARVLVAWRLRRWDPIDSAEYATVPLHGEDDRLEAASLQSAQQREVCMDLRRRRFATDIEGIRLRSSWRPLLLGRAPAILGVSQYGDCIGPGGCGPPRRFGPCQANVGPDLMRGWVVDATPGQERLIVWDLPLDPDDADDRIRDAVRDAAQGLGLHRESHYQWGAAPDGGGPGEPPPDLSAGPGPATPRVHPPAAATPYEEADPFGRDSKE